MMLIHQPVVVFAVLLLTLCAPVAAQDCLWQCSTTVPAGQHLVEVCIWTGPNGGDPLVCEWEEDCWCDETVVIEDEPIELYWVFHCDSNVEWVQWWVQGTPTDACANPWREPLFTDGFECGDGRSWDSWPYRTLTPCPEGGVSGLP